MIVCVPKETAPTERRVALVPDLVPRLTKASLEVVVEPGAGEAAGFPDQAYQEKGARLEGGAERNGRPDRAFRPLLRDGAKPATGARVSRNTVDAGITRIRAERKEVDPRRFRSPTEQPAAATPSSWEAFSRANPAWVRPDRSARPAAVPGHRRGHHDPPASGRGLARHVTAVS